jgi:putative chitinase
VSFLQALAVLFRKPDPTPSRKEEAAPVAVSLTEKQFSTLFPKANPMIRAPLNRVMARYKIDSPVRAAAFLAQIGHESAGLTLVVENLNYSAEGLAATWPSRYRGTSGAPNALAQNLARKPEAIANNTYANRIGNGDEASGGGWKFRGRGFMQTTGRANYAKLGAAVGTNFTAVPELLEQPEYAAVSAAFFWHSNGLNELADAGEFDQITRKINGGTHGTADRRARWEKAKQVLNGNG